MIPKDSILRVARPTDNLEEIKKMYSEGLGFELLASFEDHDSFSGVILGHKNHPYHLEFTHHAGSIAGKAPTKDNLLVFYLPDPVVWQKACAKLTKAGFVEVEAFNPYWDVSGRTFEDADGYRVVLQNRVWTL